MQTTNIEWADWTWNPVRGCSRISPGCKNCYAELDMARKNSNPKVPGCHGFAEFRIVGQKREAHWTGKVELIESKLLEPLSWRKKALKFAREHGRKPRVFISMSDLFHERLPDEAIDRIIAGAAICPEMDFLFLTKRAERMAKYWLDFQPSKVGMVKDILHSWWPLPNVWLGVSVEDQRRADERIPHLLRTPAAVRFLSVEPMLEEIDLGKAVGCGYYCHEAVGHVDHAFWTPGRTTGIQWVICGGESGANARPFNLAWARSLRDQCKAAGVAFYFKQAGSNCVETSEFGAWVTAGTVPLKDKKGGDPAEWPADLRIQEVPDVTRASGTTER